ncbi:MAG: hypothetical protein DME64_04855 [Verrucomicrobia bacterium]|nr:MAG: hypothetical protein DME64_04855 [Verrucomicrobiota bacterium]
MIIFRLVDRRNSRGRKGRTAGRLFSQRCGSLFITCAVRLFWLDLIAHEITATPPNPPFQFLWTFFSAELLLIFFFSSAVFLAYDRIPEELYLSG